MVGSIDQKYLVQSKNQKRKVSFNCGEDVNPFLVRSFIFLRLDCFKKW